MTVMTGSNPGQTWVRPGSNLGQTWVRPGSDPKTTERGGLKFAALVVLLGVAAACARGQSPLEIALSTRDGAPPCVTVSGFSSAEINALRGVSAETWPSIFTITVAGNEALPVAGKYAIAGDAVEFHPSFGFDAGRTYGVRFDASRLPSPRTGPPVVTTIQVPAGVATAATRVIGISPGGGVWPENTLRFYIQFSGPMSRTSALGHVRLEDDAGREVREPFLPLDVDMWNADRTRFTVFFDPGRVKRGIRPNIELGRALDAGRKYAIVVESAWPDAAGRPLDGTFRYAFTAAPPEERAVTPSDWKITPPAADTREALLVTFPWPLDRALLQRAIGVSGPSQTMVSGEISIDERERQWRFVPAGSWQAGPYQLLVLTLLEDPAGNRVGRPFEIEMLQKPAAPQAERVTVSFSIDRR